MSNRDATGTAEPIDAQDRFIPGESGNCLQRRNTGLLMAGYPN